MTIAGGNSELKIMKYGVPQGSVLGPLLFLLYINDLNKAINYCVTRHFADDTNLLIKNKANKISLNASKTEMLIFRHPNKTLNYDLKINLDRKRLYPSRYVKYLGILIDSHLNWSYHVELLAPKLSRAICMLPKIRHFIQSDTYNIFWNIFFNSNVWFSNLGKSSQYPYKSYDKITG